MGKCIIREAGLEDIEGIARLRLKIKEFQPVEIEEYIAFWKSWINDNPASKQKVFVAVNDQNRIVGHYAMVPFDFLRNGNSLSGGFVGQLMVDEEYRNELLFPKMLLKMIRGYKDIGVDFAYSLSNRPEVVKAHQSFGFHKIGALSVYAKPYRLTKIIGHLVKNRLLTLIMKPCLFAAEKMIPLIGSSGNKHLTVQEISSFDVSIDKFIEEVQQHFSYCIVRNATVLNWLTVNSTARKYRAFIAKEEGKTIGYVVVRRMKMKQFDVLAIVDILFSPERPDAGKALLYAVHRIALQTNTDLTSCLLSTHDPLFPILKRAGYYKTPESITLFTHEPKGTDPHFSEETFDKWHITWLDHDSV